MTANTLPLDGPSAFEREVVNAIGLTVVDFWANWCGPCRALAPSLERLAASFAGRAKIAKVELGVGLDLDLGDLGAAGEGRGQALEARRQGAAGAAPVGPEVDQGEPGRVDDLALEAGAVQRKSIG